MIVPMKTSAALLLSLFLLASCASRDGFIDQQTLECGPGQAVTIQAGLDAQSPRMEGMDDQHALIVLVGNNSHEEIVVKYVRVSQRPDSTATYRFSGGSRTFDEAVAEGAEGEFKILMTGRPIRPEVEAMRSDAAISLDVTVGLSNGDQYRCAFEIPIR